MEKEKNEQGINISAITFDEYGEMVVLDDELLELVSGGASFMQVCTTNVVGCGAKGNGNCPNLKCGDKLTSDAL